MRGCLSSATTTKTSEKELAEVYDGKGVRSGLDVLDDGQKVTFVQKDRDPCPSQFPPHPGPDQTFAFRLSTTPLTFDRVSCTLPKHCPKSAV